MLQATSMGGGSTTSASNTNSNLCSWSDGTPLKQVHVLDSPKHVEERRSHFEEVANSKHVPPGWLTLSAASEDTIPSNQGCRSDEALAIKFQPEPTRTKQTYGHCSVVSSSLYFAEQASICGQA